MTYDISLLDNFVCLIHNRTGHVIRKMIQQIITERFKLFEELRNHVINLKEKEAHEVFAEFAPMDVEGSMTKICKDIQEDIVKQIVLDKDKTPIYDFECDHDADENY